MFKKSIMMRSIVSVLVTLLSASAVVAFLPVSAPRAAVLLASAGLTTDPIDIEHAKYCSDHFGECSLEDLERMRDGEYDQHMGK